jgi:hypothetical protein
VEQELAPIRVGELAEGALIAARRARQQLLAHERILARPVPIAGITHYDTARAQKEPPARERNRRRAKGTAGARKEPPGADCQERDPARPAATRSVSGTAGVASSESTTTATAEEVAMSTFLFTYRVPKQPLDEVLAELDEAGRAARADAWSGWLESMGASVVERGAPVLDARVVGNSDGDTRIGGYSLITAEDFEAAVALAMGCPGLELSGGVEIGEVVPVNELDRVGRR